MSNEEWLRFGLNIVYRFRANEATTILYGHVSVNQVVGLKFSTEPNECLWEGVYLQSSIFVIFFVVRQTLTEGDER